MKKRNCYRFELSSTFKAISGLVALTAGLIFCRSDASAEIYAVDGKPAKWNDVIEVRLRDLHPTQPSVGFDRIYYKLGRFAKDRRKLFDEFCEKNGQTGVRNFTNSSTLRDPKSYSCLNPVGTFRGPMKTAVIAPNGELYLTDGHHTFNTYWEMEEGGPELAVDVVLTRDYRNFSSMDDFWDQMQTEQNVWLRDADDNPITPKDLPVSLGLKNFGDDMYRGIMFFTRSIAWASPGQITVDNPDTFDDKFPVFPFVEYCWAREIRKRVNLSDFDLNSRSGYMIAIRAVAKEIMSLQTVEVGGRITPAKEMGQFRYLNQRELLKFERSGKLDYLVEYKNSLRQNALINSQRYAQRVK